MSYLLVIMGRITTVFNANLIYSQKAMPAAGYAYAQGDFTLLV
ncbi:MAG: hypothetical protein V7L04_15960 [Nostoc sp.]